MMSQPTSVPTTAARDAAAAATTRLTTSGHHPTMEGLRRCLLACAACSASLGLVVASLRWRVVAVGDKISYPHGAFVLAMGFVFFVALTQFLQTLLLHTHLGRTFCRRYRLIASDALEITNKLVSGVQATLSCTAGFMVCNSSCRRSFLTASHFMSDTYAWFGCAYFVYDMWSMFEVHLQKVADKVQLLNSQPSNTGETTLYDKSNGLKVEPFRLSEAEHKVALHRLRKVDTKAPGFLRFCLSDPVMTLHHVFLQSFGLFVIVYLRGNFGDCVYGFVYLMEFSTPFVSIRSILSTLHLKNSRLYVLNGLVMLATFFVCRVAMWPYLYWWYGQTVNKNIFQAIYSLPRTCKIGTAVLFFPQIYWFYLMVSGAVQVLFTGSKAVQLTPSPSDDTINTLPKKSN